MNFIKKNLKCIITIVGVIILTTGISVYATTIYLAGNVIYKNGNSVADALDDLYNKSVNYILPSGTENIIANGTYEISEKASVNVNVTAVAIAKTSLWTNSDSTSEFDSQDITLSQSLANYTHILIQFKSLNSNAEIYDDIFKLSPERNASLASNGRFSIGTSYSNANGAYYRIMSVVDNFTIRVGTATRTDNNTSTTRLVPTAIYGLNFSY